jgi:hypothetical protein
MEPIDFSPPKRSNSPNLPYLRSALVEIGEELDRGPSSPHSSMFTPFGVLEGYLPADPRTEMAKSLRLAPNKAGLLRLGQDRAPSLTDLPKLTGSAAKTGRRPPRSTPVTVEINPMEISVVEMEGGALALIGFDELQNVRVDNDGRYFFMVSGAGTDPLCFTAMPWIVPALAILMVVAARKGVLRRLQADIESKVRSL